jgi:Domain of unknown function (DUF4160)
MPTISMFYGLLVSMYFMDTAEHNSPHIHVRYQGQRAVFGIPDGDLLVGTLPPKQRKLVEAWIAIHADELMADWTLAIEGKELFRIDPLK